MCDVLHVSSFSDISQHTVSSILQSISSDHEPGLTKKPKTLNARMGHITCSKRTAFKLGSPYKILSVYLNNLGRHISDTVDIIPPASRGSFSFLQTVSINF